MTDELLGSRDFSARMYAFQDITIRSDGDGRTVEAYVAPFDVRAEVRDADGHYNEDLARGSFDKTLSERGTNFGVFYNHAKTIYGTPDGNLSVPIGVPVDVRADERGVWSATRYLDNPLADSVLDGIKQRAIRGQSFGGRFVKSVRSRATKRGDLPTITRTEVAMKEYGPTVFPVYNEAMILGTRSVTSFLEELGQADPEDLDRLRHMLGTATPLGEPAAPPDTAPAAVPADEPAFAGHSALRSKFTFSAEARKRGVRR